MPEPEEPSTSSRQQSQLISDTIERLRTSAHQTTSVREKIELITLMTKLRRTDDMQG